MSNGDWELPRGRGWLLLRISKHSIQPFTGKGARIGHMQACFKRQMLVQCQGLACFHSLTAPPTVCSYITPSPSAGPLPAFIGLFLVFSTLALHPADRCLSPNHPSAASSAIIVLFPSQCGGDISGQKPWRLGHFPGGLLRWILHLSKQDCAGFLGGGEGGGYKLLGLSHEIRAPHEQQPKNRFIIQTQCCNLIIK